jgi:hypothetical protein
MNSTTTAILIAIERITKMGERILALIILVVIPCIIGWLWAEVCYRASVSEGRRRYIDGKSDDPGNEDY